MINIWLPCAALLFLSMYAQASSIDDCTKFFAAIEKEDFNEVFRLSLQGTRFGACTNAQGENAMHIFAQGSGDENVFAALFYLAKADINAVNSHGKTPLMYAAGKVGSMSGRRLLFCLTPRVNKNAQDRDGNTALHHGAIARNVDFIKELLSWGAKPDIKNLKDQSYQEIPHEEVKPKALTADESDDSQDNFVDLIMVPSKPGINSFEMTEFIRFK